MDGFSDEERDKISGFLYEMACLNKDQYFVVRCKDTPVAKVWFWNRHQIAGTLWMGLEGEYLSRNYDLSDEQQGQANVWRAHADRYLERLSQSYFYSDGASLMNDEGGMVLRMCLMKGLWTRESSEQLRLLADYFVASHDNLGQYASNGHGGSTQHRPVGGEILNAASWLCPGEGYAWFRRRLGPAPYGQFMFYMAYGTSVGLPYFNWETPMGDDGSEALKKRMTGLFVLPVG